MASSRAAAAAAAPAATGVGQVDVFKKGFLQRREPARWAKRYVVLDNMLLTVFEKEPETQERVQMRQMPTGANGARMAIDRFTSVLVSSAKKFAVEVRRLTPEGEVAESLMLSMASKVDRDAWHAALRQSIDLAQLLHAQRAAQQQKDDLPVVPTIAAEAFAATQPDRREYDRLQSGTPALYRHKYCFLPYGVAAFEKDQTRRKLVLEVLVYTGFVALLMLYVWENLHVQGGADLRATVRTALLQRPFNASSRGGQLLYYDDLAAREDWLDWVEGGLVGGSGVFGADGQFALQSFVIGAVRLRQLRTKPRADCELRPQLASVAGRAAASPAATASQRWLRQHHTPGGRRLHSAGNSSDSAQGGGGGGGGGFVLPPDCYPVYGLLSRDTSPFGPGPAAPPPATPFPEREGGLYRHSAWYELSRVSSNATNFMAMAPWVNLGGVGYTDYDWSGFKVDLPARDPARARAIVQQLRADGWVDAGTAAVVASFSIYNVPLNMMGQVLLLAEFSPLGATFTHLDFQPFRLPGPEFKPPGAVDDLPVRIALGVLVLAYLVRMVLGIRRDGASLWDVLDVANFAIILASFGLRMYFEVDPVVRNAGRYLGTAEYVPFEGMAWLLSVERVLAGVNMWLCCAKYFKYLRVDARLSLGMTVLSDGGLYYISFLFTFAILALGVMLCSHLLFGPSLQAFHTTNQATLTFLNMFVGRVDYILGYDRTDALPSTGTRAPLGYRALEEAGFGSRVLLAQPAVYYALFCAVFVLLLSNVLAAITIASYRSVNVELRVEEELAANQRAMKAVHNARESRSLSARIMHELTRYLRFFEGQRVLYRLKADPHLLNTIYASYNDLSRALADTVPAERVEGYVKRLLDQERVSMARAKDVLALFKQGKLAPSGGAAHEQLPGDMKASTAAAAAGSAWAGMHRRGAASARDPLLEDGKGAASWSDDEFADADDVGMELVRVRRADSSASIDDELDGENMKVTDDETGLSRLRWKRDLQAGDLFHCMSFCMWRDMRAALVEMDDMVDAAFSDERRLLDRVLHLERLLQQVMHTYVEPKRSVWDSVEEQQRLLQSLPEDSALATSLRVMVAREERRDRKARLRRLGLEVPDSDRESDMDSEVAEMLERESLVADLEARALGDRGALETKDGDDDDEEEESSDDE